MELPLVFMDGPWRLGMGLRTLEPGQWLWLDDRHRAETAERRRLIAEKPDEVVAMPTGTEPACHELLAAVLEDLARHHAACHHAACHHAALPAGGRSDRPLVDLGGLTQEDFCLLMSDADGRHVLRAGVLCFPLHWRLRDKLGLPLRAIHGPVPGFADRLGDPAERFMASLQPERPVWRANWTFTEKPDLHQPGRREVDPLLDCRNAGGRLWLRVERQTLRRLPVSRAVVFGIRSVVRPLGEIAAEPGVATALAARLREMEPAMASYKGIPAMREPLLRWLDDAAAVGPAPQQPAARRQAGAP
ncbi:MAG TPA: DUF3445 domain-containing protein [Geminicoccaceae bacterium]|nr:DUF3445 domain-containing protein [Geminicoccus sp.]HMU49944.1 DUF3445 domain-containing protein [Geminicoccaceae bacterium]